MHAVSAPFIQFFVDDLPACIYGFFDREEGPELLELTSGRVRWRSTPTCPQYIVHVWLPLFVNGTMLWGVRSGVTFPLGRFRLVTRPSFTWS